MQAVKKIGVDQPGQWRSLSASLFLAHANTRGQLFKVSLA